MSMENITKITVKYFSVISEITQKNEEEFSFNNPLTVAELFDFLNLRYDLHQHQDYLRFAVNCEYVKKDFLIKAHDEVALITPVAGG